ncbi:hypothetical protein [Haloarcula sp. K1]|uniref:hypothetical protein n=1 Tax=Haloarcula sp. K1 TaxID=1622207 RepID=UPI0007BC4FB2|nr:hypothetical protein [Haloarcula sp. K1]KZX46337.1 hypothetical protein AV929_16335 [Haloarcula sp. K1]
MNNTSCSSLAALEDSGAQFVYNDTESILEKILDVNAEYDDKGMPEGTVTVKPVAWNDSFEVDAEDFDTDLHNNIRNVIDPSVIENAEQILINLGLNNLIEDKRVLGPAHDYNLQHGDVDEVTEVRDLLAVEQIYQADAVAE